MSVTVELKLPLQTAVNVSHDLFLATPATVPPRPDGGGGGGAGGGGAGGGGTAAAEAHVLAVQQHSSAEWNSPTTPHPTPINSKMKCQPLQTDL